MDTPLSCYSSIKLLRNFTNVLMSFEYTQNREEFTMFNLFKKKKYKDSEMGAKITPKVDGAYGRYKDEFIKYLEDKYQRKFLPIALYPEMEFLEFRAYPEGGDKENDEIHLYMHDYATENHIIEDDYFIETIRDEYDAYIKDFIKDYFESFRVSYAKGHHYPKDLKLGDTWISAVLCKKV